MKNLMVTLVFITLSTSFVTAQKDWKKRDIVHQKNEMSIGFGFNIVADSGLGFEEAFNAKDKWNFSIPLALNFEYYFDNKISIATMFSINRYKEGKKIDGGIILKDNEASYFASDIAAKYSFRELLKLNKWEPYVSLGVGYTHIGGHKVVFEETQEELVRPGNGTMTINTGVGINYWLSPKLGLYFNAVGKFGLSGDATNQLQYSFGGIYRLTRWYQ